MTCDHKKSAILELVKAACMGQASVENVVDAIVALHRSCVDKQWLPSSEYPPPALKHSNGEK